MDTSSILEQDRAEVLGYINSIMDPVVMRQVKDAVATIIASGNPRQEAGRACGSNEPVEFLNALRHAWGNSPSLSKLADDLR